MQAFLAELTADLRSRVPFVVWFLLSISVAVMGPFGTYGVMPFSSRFLFWMTVMALGIGVGTVIRAYVYGSLGLKDFRRGSLLITVLVCTATCPPLYLLVKLVFAERMAGVPGFLEILLLVASLSLGVCALRLSFLRNVVLAAGQEVPPPIIMPVVQPLERRLPRLVQRMEPDLQGKLWSISVRDHYVDVLTDRGQSSLLLRFGDAVAEAEPVEGAQVHRSHWVAWDAVEAVERDGLKVVLRLRSGQKVPVSRNHRVKVDERWPVEDLPFLQQASG